MVSGLMIVQRERYTLQKSIDFTPLLPSAGPTGGDGDAWPAPTMSLTIWSDGGSLRAIVCDVRLDAPQDEDKAEYLQLPGTAKARYARVKQAAKTFLPE